MLGGYLYFKNIGRESFLTINKIRKLHEKLREYEPHNELLKCLEIEVIEEDSPYPDIFSKNMTWKYNEEIKRYSKKDSVKSLLTDIPEGINDYISDLERELNKFEEELR